MLDFNRFWAEPGSAPGMSKEETEAYLRNTGLAGVPFEALGIGGTRQPRPGVTANQIAAWEKKHGVRLPDVLRQALARQDGGHLRGVDFLVLPLAEIVPPDEDFWDYASSEEDELPDRNLVLQLGENESGGTCYLNYSNGPQQEPSVYLYYGDGGDFERCADSVTKFFTRMLKTADAPSVTWAETTSLQVIAQEAIDLSPLYRMPAQAEMILGRKDGMLTLFSHERSAVAERFTKTTLPEPLVEAMAMIRPHRPDPIGTHALTLQPQTTDGIVELTSERTSDGKWKNNKTTGVPICVQFESKDRAKLESLRKTLIGEHAAGGVAAQEKSLEEYQQRMEGVTLQERVAAGMEMFKQMKARLFHGGAPSNMPPEASALQELLQQRLREMEERLKKKPGN
jgi:hypothetical protein